MAVDMKKLEEEMKKLEEEESKRIEVLRTMSEILNLSQDIEDIYDDEDLDPDTKLRRMLDKAQRIQMATSKVLPG